MDLKTFVAESLVQISAGIKEAQQAGTGAWIAPEIAKGDKGLFARSGFGSPMPQFINFDIAVSVSEADTSKGGGGVQVLGIAIGGSIENAVQNSSVSRIKFEIPIVWPDGGDRPR